MKETNHTLPDWFDGEVYEEGAVVTNQFSGEDYLLNAGELSMYDLIMGINYVGDHRGWDDELINTHSKALSWFITSCIISSNILDLIKNVTKPFSLFAINLNI